MSSESAIRNRPTLRELIILAITLLISFVIGIMALLLTFEVLISYLPSEKILEDGTVERYQPFFQLFISVGVGIIVFVAIAIIGFSILNKRMLKSSRT
ncbi:MAG: hypothetical protein COA33_013140 [Fluviicola sp.]|nr:hypothetical protein [Fluviicola sp.]